MDYLIIPDTKYKYSRYAESLTLEFDTSNVLLYDNSSTREIYTLADCVKQLDENMSVTLELNQYVKDTIITVDKGMFQYLECNGKTVLIITGNPSVSLLKEEYRKADYLVLDKVVKNSDLLQCDQLVFSGSKKDFNKKYNSLKEICPDIISTHSGDLELRI